MSDEYVFPRPLHGLEIQVDRCLVGSKHAVQFGNGPVLVSPAMHDLIKNATPDELETLLKAICIKKLPALPSLRDYMSVPMYTSAPKRENT